MKKKQKKKKQNKNDSKEPKVQADQEAKEVEPEEEPIEEGAEINRLLDEGYSVKQIMALGFKRRTAYHHAKLRMKPENDPAGNGQDEALSAVHAGKGRQELLKLSAKDVIPPEAVLEVLHLPRNGDAVEVWRRGLIDGVGMLLLGARYAQLTAAGQADIVKSQLDIMREAKGAANDIAQEAAQHAAVEVAGYIEQKLDNIKAKGSGEPDMVERMMSPVATMIGKHLSNMFGRMLGISSQGQGTQFETPPGWEYKTEKGDE